MYMNMKSTLNKSSHIDEKPLRDFRAAQAGINCLK